MNKYRKGARLEYQVVHEYRERGWVAWRSAGSHSPIDVTAVEPKTMSVMLIQCKNKILTRAEVAREKRALKEYRLHSKTITSTTGIWVALCYKCRVRGKIRVIKEII